jgi:hypothetical protein
MFTCDFSATFAKYRTRKQRWHVIKRNRSLKQTLLDSYGDDGRFNCCVCLKGFSGRGAIDFIKLMQSLTSQEATEFLRPYAKTAQLKEKPPMKA